MDKRPISSQPTGQQLRYRLTRKIDHGKQSSQNNIWRKVSCHTVKIRAEPCQQVFMCTYLGLHREGAGIGPLQHLQRQHCLHQKSFANDHFCMSESTKNCSLWRLARHLLRLGLLRFVLFPRVDLKHQADTEGGESPCSSVPMCSGERDGCPGTVSAAGEAPDIT